MPKPEWGAKRMCLSCGARFYDLNADPATCPECGAAFEIEALARTRRPRPAAKEKVVAVDPALLDDEAGIETEDADAAIDDDDDDVVDDDDDEVSIEVVAEAEAEEEDAAIDDDVLIEADEDEDDEDDLDDFSPDEDEDRR